MNPIEIEVALINKLDEPAVINAVEAAEVVDARNVDVLGLLVFGTPGRVELTFMPDEPPNDDDGTPVVTVRLAS